MNTHCKIHILKKTLGTSSSLPEGSEEGYLMALVSVQGRLFLGYLTLCSEGLHCYGLQGCILHRIMYFAPHPRGPCNLKVLQRMLIIVTDILLIQKQSPDGSSSLSTSFKPIQNYSTRTQHV